MIDYKKLGRVLESEDQQKVDTVLNTDHKPLISQYNDRFIKYGFVEVQDNKYRIKMSKRERDIFQITKDICDEETGFAYGVIGKLLSDDTEERLKKDEDLLRDQLTIQGLEHEKVSKSHKKLVGDLYREIDETKKDNKKLSKQVEDLDRPKKLRAKGLM